MSWTAHLWRRLLFWLSTERWSGHVVAVVAVAVAAVLAVGNVESAENIGFEGMWSPVSS